MLIVYIHRLIIYLQNRNFSTVLLKSSWKAKFILPANVCSGEGNSGFHFHIQDDGELHCYNIFTLWLEDGSGTKIDIHGAAMIKLRAAALTSKHSLHSVSKYNWLDHIK